MAIIELKRRFDFEAAHCLKRVPQGHKCAQLHGHRFEIIVMIKGEIDPEQGWLMDFKEVREIVDPVIDLLDHKCLNDIEGLENPTSENLSVWFWNKLKEKLPFLSGIEVFESPHSSCLYRGE